MSTIFDMVGGCAQRFVFRRLFYHFFYQLTSSGFERENYLLGGGSKVHYSGQIMHFLPNFSTLFSVQTSRLLVRMCAVCYLHTLCAE